MKKIKIIVSFLAFLMVTSVSFAQKKTDQFTVKVDGLGCPFCAYGLEKKLKKIASIGKVTIDMETGMTEFKVASENQISMEEVIEKVQKAGYTPVEMSVTRSNGLVENMEPKVKAKVDEKALAELKVTVKGNCEMCKARIEKAALGLKDVTYAVWNVETKELQLKAKGTVTKETISKAIANSGHDTELVKAKDEVYENLPVCCLYRKR